MSRSNEPIASRRSCVHMSNIASLLMMPFSAEPTKTSSTSVIFSSILARVMASSVGMFALGDDEDRFVHVEGVKTGGLFVQKPLAQISSDNEQVSFLRQTEQLFVACYLL